MAYLARKDILTDGSYFHVTWQFHNNEWFLRDDWAKRLYYDLLVKYKDKYGVDVYSYSLMSSHPHLTGKTDDLYGISRYMKVVNSIFARKINRLMKRRGQVILDRFKSPVIQTGDHHLAVMIYGDMNAPRAGMVKHPRDYVWCSYLHYAFGKPDPLITDAPAFLELGKTLEECQREYRRMVEAVVEEDRLKRSNSSKSQRKTEVSNVANGNEDETQKYDDVYYIGDPAWVIQKYKDLQEKRRKKQEEVHKGQNTQNDAAAPPA